LGLYCIMMVLQLNAYCDTDVWVSV
jgi:hypothetical protein